MSFSATRALQADATAPAWFVNVPAETKVWADTALTAAAAAFAHMTAFASAHCCREALEDMSYLQK